MDMSALTGALAGLAYAKNVFQGLLKAKVAVETHAQIDDALEKLGQAQEALFEARDELFRFQQTNQDLRAQLKTRDDWDARLAMYRVATTAGGATVYEHTGAPPHYACPSCMNDRKIQILQDRRVMGGVWDCPGCKATYPIDPMKAAAARAARSPYLERRRRDDG